MLKNHLYSSTFMSLGYENRMNQIANTSASACLHQSDLARLVWSILNFRANVFWLEFIRLSVQYHLLYMHCNYIFGVWWNIIAVEVLIAYLYWCGFELYARSHPPLIKFTQGTDCSICKTHISSFWCLQNALLLRAGPYSSCDGKACNLSNCPLLHLMGQN